MAGIEIWPISKEGFRDCVIIACCSPQVSDEKILAKASTAYPKYGDWSMMEPVPCGIHKDKVHHVLTGEWLSK